MIEQFIMRIIIIKQWKNKYTIMIALISCVMFKYTKISIDPGNKSSNTTLFQENLNIVAIYSTLSVEIISTVRLLIDNNINT